ncbi:MAG: ribosome rescue protein RqcH [Candidatus Nanoarchaeia archaeon]|jgi:predicted ribosome quality control (RQC) complex YloA/Tae2 family protein|nr:ribosome rescue protein RqcH [Candidatus Nanoarchaeia archaeon]|tara:strand:- start:738 stop:2678 length:1941 start_codon:yes stop_codon:yes gene_type:complete
MRILTSLELRIVVNELKENYLNSKLAKIYLPKTRILRLELHRAGRGRSTLIVDSGVGMYLSKFNFENPTVPPAFAMFLRRHLLQATLKDVVQRGSERIVEFRFNTKNGTRFLICELFGKGNFILTDTNYVILNSAVIQKTKERTIKKGETYSYPKQGFDILNLTRADFDKGLSKWKEHSIVKYLASGLGLGGKYAEEVCARAKIDKGKQVGLFVDKDLTKVFDSVLDLVAGFDSDNAIVVMEDGKAVNAFPFLLKSLEDSEVKKVGSFSEAVDLLFSEGRVSEVRKQKSSAFDKRLAKVEKIVDSQRKSVEMLKAKQADLKSKIEVVYRNYQYISKIVERLNKAREAGHSWTDIIEAAEKERESGLVEAEMFRSINPEEKLVVLEVEDHTVELNLDKKIENFTDELYNQVKNMNSKISGAERTMNKYVADRDKLLAQKSEVMEGVESSLPTAREVVKKEWYEKFRWFFTSSGLLAVGGRDATSNEMVIKKHMEIEDWVFHTSMAGSPFFLLKKGKDKASAEDIEEVAIATASYSRAWQNGYSTQEVFYVRPEQVSKKAEAGEYLTKGSFMVRGKRNLLNPELEVCVGVVNGKVVGGPRSVIVEGDVYCLVPGKTKKSDIAKKIAQKLGRSVDEVMSVLPNGTSDLV